MTQVFAQTFVDWSIYSAIESYRDLIVRQRQQLFSDGHCSWTVTVIVIAMQNNASIEINFFCPRSPRSNPHCGLLNKMATHIATCVGCRLSAVENRSLRIAKEMCRTSFASEMYAGSGEDGKCAGSGRPCHFDIHMRMSLMCVAPKSSRSPAAES